jgi:tetratricopeptide (TPR) repeat protein
VTATPTASTDPATSARNFTDQGEAAFKAGDYKGAVYAWKHALVDDAQNPVLLMMLAQALFANGSYEEAAGATQAAMHMIPKDKWGVVVTNYKDLYGNVQDYTTQLRGLEKAVKDKPDNPALRFLAGFHYAYLGFPKEAVDQLDKAIKLQPQDEMAKALREEMQAKLPKPVAPPAAVPPTPELQAPSALRLPLAMPSARAA